MKNESLNEGHRYRIASRWEYVAQGRIPTALLAAWKRVLSWARSGAFRTVGAGVLVATLAACSSGGAQEPLTAPPAPTQSQSQSAEPETPMEAPVENLESSFSMQSSEVEIPQDVIDAYGADAAGKLPADAFAVASLANELQDLHHARETNDLETSWVIYQEYMTPEAFQRLQDNVAAAAAGDEKAFARLDSLQPLARQDGVLATIDGTTYRSGERGIAVEITSAPTVRLDQHEQFGQRVAMDFPQRATAYTDNGKALTFTMTKTLVFTPGADGHWLLDGYAASSVEHLPVADAQ